MKSFLIGLSNSQPSRAQTTYRPFVNNGTQGWSTYAAQRRQPLPHAITLDNFRVVMTNAPGSSNSFVFTVYKNGVATALTVTITGTATSAQDLTHSVSFAAGDFISMVCTAPSAVLTSGTIYWTARQDATSNHAVLGTADTGSSGLVALMGVSTGTIATGDSGMVIPCAGTLSNLYTTTVGSNVIITVYKNGSATSMTVTGTSGSDTTHTVSVTAGDRIAINKGVTGGSGQAGSWGLTFTPTNDGDSFIGNVDNNHNNNSSATSYYQPLADGTGTWDTTESNVYLMLQACTVTGLYIQTSVSPGASPAAYAFTVRQNAADTAATVTVNDASPAGNDGSGRAGNITGQSVTINDDDLIDISSTPSGSPLGIHPYCSILINVATGGGGGGTQYVSFLSTLGVG